MSVGSSGTSDSQPDATTSTGPPAAPAGSPSAGERSPDAESPDRV
jgi:hypothetical protein